MSARPLVPALALAVAASVLVAATALSGCCSDTTTDGPDLGAELRALRKSLDASRDATARLSTEVQRQNRRLNDLSRRVTENGERRRMVGTPSAPAAPGHEGEAAAAGVGSDASAPTSEIASEVAAVLASEDGRKVVAAAARGAIAERASRERDAFVAYSLSRFADEAGLSETQSREVRKVWDDVMADARKMMRDAAPKPGMTPEERAQKVQEISAGMRDLGTRRQEEMRSILDDTQWELYEKRQEDIDAGLHGAPPRGRTETGSGDAPQR